MKVVNLLTCLVVLSACDHQSKTTKATSLSSSPTSAISVLKKEKAKTDSLVHLAIRNPKAYNLLVLVKLNDDDKLKVVSNGNFPENVETTFNVLSNKNDKIIYILASPFSESDDWDIEYKSYFDENGKLYAFEKFTGSFDETCSSTAVHETIVSFFNSSAKLVDSTYRLTDAEGHAIADKQRCKPDYKFPYSIIKTVKGYLVKNKITMSQLN